MKLFYSTIKFFIAILAIIILLMIKSFACRPMGSNAYNHIYNVPLNESIIQRDAPIGSTVLTQSVSTGLASNDVFADCSAGDQGHLLFQGGTPVAGYDNIYETNVPGIGIKIEAATSNFYYTNPETINGTTAHNEDGWAWGNWGTSFEITLIKTGPVTSGDITGITAIFSMDGLGDLLTLNINSGKVTSLACSINTSKIRVPLGDVFITNFTGPGSTPKSYDFDVGLDCDAGANINVSLDGTQSAETGDTSVLALTGAGEDNNVATGVGVQILYNNTPLKLNENIVLKKSQGGQELLPFTARYYQTRPEVTMGSADATATLNITYQ